MATCGYVLFVRALKFSAHALTYLFLNRADGRAVNVELCCGNLRLELLVRALKLSAYALTCLFLNRADGLCGEC